MKKKLLALLGFASTGAVFAEGEGATMDTSAAAQMVSSATTGLADFLNTVTPYLVTLMLAGLAVWAGIVVIRLVKRVFSRGS